MSHDNAMQCITHSAKGEIEDDGRERTSGLVNVCKPLWRVASLGQCEQHTRSGIHRCQADRHDTDADCRIHKMIEAADTGEIHHDNERRRTGGSVVIGQALVGPRDIEADDDKGQDVDHYDSPEGTFDSLWQGLAGVRGLSGGQTDELSSCEREGSSDEHRAYTLEAVGERSRVLEESSSNIFAVDTGRRSSTAIDNDAHEDENDDDQQFDASSPKFAFGVTE